jgi:hypothetical protein
MESNKKICGHIYRTRTHQLCGQLVPGVSITCQYSESRCSLDCSDKCPYFTEAKFTVKEQHNREFVEHTQNILPLSEPLRPEKVSAPIPQMNTNENSIVNNAPQRTGGCGRCGAKNAGYAQNNNSGYAR